MAPQQTEINLLLVEDNPGDQRLIREMLVDADFSIYHIQVLTTLSEAITWVKQSPCDVVLLDLTLSDSSGIETYLQLRNNARSVPIIVLTGLDDRDTALVAVEHGAQDFLSKNHIDTFVLERSIGYAISRKQLEDRNRLQAVALESAANAVFISDQNGVIEWVNAAFCAMMGYEWDEVIGKTPSFFSADEFSTELFMNNLKEIGEEGKVWTHELRNRCKDGRIIIVEQTITSFSGSTHQVTNFVAIQQDITQRKHNQEAIQSYSQMLEKVNVFSRFLSESMNPDEIYERLKNHIFSLLPEIHTIVFSEFDPKEQVFQTSEVYYQIGYEIDQARSVPSIEYTVPMVAQDSVVGMITLASDAADTFSTTNAETLGIIANTAAVALENAQLFENSQLQISRLSSLRAIDIAITSGADLKSNLAVLVEQVSRQLAADAVNILLLNPVTGVLETFAGAGFRTELFDHQVLTMGQGYAGKAAANNQLIQIPDLANALEQPFPESLLAPEGFQSYFSAPLVAKGELQGVLEVFLRKPFQPDKEWLDYLEALAGQAAIAVDNDQLFTNLQITNAELVNAYNITIEGWSRAVELRDVETEGHTRRVAQLTMELVDRMGIPEERKVHIRRGAILHDIGKIGVPDHILLKPGGLTDEEWVIMKSHPTLAYEMLLKIEYLQPAIQIPYAHHEKWDGSGYPRGLKGEEIPVEARIFAIVDVYDALTSDRPYRKAWPEEKVIEHIIEQSGSHFDPVVVNVFLQFMEARQRTEQKTVDTRELLKKDFFGSDKRVVLVEDSPIIRERLRETIDVIDGLSVVAEADDTVEALRLINYINAAIYVLDIRMPGGGGMLVLEHLKALPNPPVVIIFTSFANERYRKSYAKAGADFFYDKSTDMEALIQTLYELAVFDSLSI